MSIEALGPGLSTPQIPDPPGIGRVSSGGAVSFGDTLDRLLAEPRSEISAIRSEVAAIHEGTPIFARPYVSPHAGADMWSAGGVTELPRWLEGQLATLATGDVGDPYGWRGTSRHIGERVIGPGYGALFERQIQQESGFRPEVVYGLRVSTAGAEGIAQLMPQYYPHVARIDPVAGLRAGAESMRQYLDVWNGDVRKALASYNAGPGRVHSLVSSLGVNWEAGLPQETRTYLAAIVGDAAPRFLGPSVLPHEGIPENGDLDDREPQP